MGQTGSYTISKISLDNFQDDEFANNLVIENEADGGLVDFTESNPSHVPATLHVHPCVT